MRSGRQQEVGTSGKAVYRPPVAFLALHLASAHCGMPVPMFWVQTFSRVEDVGHP